MCYYCILHLRSCSIFTQKKELTHFHSPTQQQANILSNYFASFANICALSVCIAYANFGVNQSITWILPIAIQQSM